MTGEKGEFTPPRHEIDAQWDECVDLTVRRFIYSSVSGGFGGLLLFRSPVSRWAAVAFGAGIGIGSAYTECSQKFGGFPIKFLPPAPKVANVTAPETAPQSPVSQVTDISE
ncbi:hypothetical protein SAY87_000238 [Trapa incisa]|uniref:MICOS complex subunit Mic10 n=2 Tax=Trapa TaxID=22665 RepID=A0AAN7MYW4_TRANT|nr:hypothetical protein SAY87_000238 [Trapa incisa]KAK4800828.1 hypothetical protein SAY86_021315 [Trapa natans]